MNYVFEEVGTLHEWSKICQRWGSGRGDSLRHVSTLSRDELLNKVVCVYKRNMSKQERDIGLVKPAGASTPTPGRYFWVSGINSIC
jgi:hypothetical protein